MTYMKLLNFFLLYFLIWYTFEVIVTLAANDWMTFEEFALLPIYIIAEPLGFIFAGTVALISGAIAMILG